MRLGCVAPVSKSPLASKGFHAKHARLLSSKHGNTSASRYLKGRRPALPTILEEDEEEEEVYTRPRRDLHNELNRLSEHSGIEDDGMDWDEETTLVTLLQDEYVPCSRVSFSRALG
jgi:hypothetical protein